MGEPTYQIVITGKLLEGHDYDEVESALCRLLKLPIEKVRYLLRGERSRIKKDLPLLKAERLRVKIERRGAECQVEAVGGSVAVDTAQQSFDLFGVQEGKVEPAAEKTETSVEAASPEIEDLDLELPDEVAVPADGVSGESNVIEEGIQATTQQESQPTPQSNVEAEPDSAKVQFYDVPSTRKPEVSGGIRLTVEKHKFALLGGLLILIILIGLGGYWGVSEEPTAPTVASVVPAKPTDPQIVATTKGMLDLAKSVRVWMIQFGSGFDPTQVTLDRLQQDLAIPAANFKDGWGRPYEYEALDRAYRLRSAGPDQKLDTSDDIHKEFKLRQ